MYDASLDDFYDLTKHIAYVCSKYFEETAIDFHAFDFFNLICDITSLEA
jgi:hypothetical protein